MTSNKCKSTPVNTSEDDFDSYHFPTTSQHPEISVVLSTYNRSREEGTCKSLLKRALDSILNQTFTNFELILIDDCSSDSTEEYCKKVALQDPRIHFFHFKKNSGLPAKRYNFGISASRGKYVTFMFDDDEWELTALEDLYQGIEKHHQDCGMVYGLSLSYCGSDHHHAKILGEPWGWKKIHSHNFIANNAVIVKRSVIDLVGGYDEDPVFCRVCDWDLWWRIGRKFKVGRIETYISILYSQLSDSLELTKSLNWEVCKSRQQMPRSLPLQKNQPEPWRCKIHAALFDIHVNYSQQLKPKKILKNLLPAYVYSMLKNIKNQSFGYFQNIFKNR